MTSIALLCWCAWLEYLSPSGWSFWSKSLVSVVVFSLMALGEYVGDTLPSTPNRTSLFPATARLVFGGVCGALLAQTAHEPLAGGILLALVGVLIGTFGGYHARMWGARKAGRDLPVAVTESGIALLFALYAVHMVHHGLERAVASEMTVRLGH